MWQPSYVDSLDFCLVACRKTMPDLDKMIDYLIDEFDKLKQLSMPAGP
ncbi:MAG: WS/DGAT domain-containing protein [Dissulfuribacterales bacterium]